MFNLMNRFILSVLLGSMAFFTFSTQAEVAVVRVDRKPQQTMTYGMDFERLWHFTENGHEIDLDELARWSVAECKVDYVRVAISAAAEPEEGQLNWSVYDRQLKMMRALKSARPDIQFFASPRPIHNDFKGAPFTPFPLWISIYTNPFQKDPTVPRKFVKFEAEKAADYYARYLRFMKEQGFTMTYLDAQNEATRYLNPVDIVRMIDRLRETMGEEMPLVIAPSAHNRGEAMRWIQAAQEMDRTDFWDITASHNTRPTGSMEDFTALAKTLNKPIWNTELHGFSGPDDQAVANSAILWEHIRAGFGGINDWLSLGNERKEHKMFRNINGKLELMRVYYIFKQLVNTSVGAQYHASTIPEPLETTAAFYQRSTGLFTVWALNNSDEPVDTVVQIDGYFCHPIEVRWWGPENGREGSVVTDGLDGESSIRHTLEGKSLYCFTFERHN